MKLKVLKTERDYQAALAYVESLMDKSALDEAELELWAQLVEKYEEEHFPLPVSDSVKAILDQDLRAYEADPTAGAPWSEVEARLRRRS